MLKTKQQWNEVFVLIVLFSFLTCLSTFQIGENISPVKYFFSFSIRCLTDNYALFHSSFKDFILKTSCFHPGNSESGWKTIVYLLPLFIFSDLTGGLSLKTVCLFTVFTSLLFLILFYVWIRRVWGKKEAFAATFFLGFSGMFQEIARSGGFNAYSLLALIIWIVVCFKNEGNEKSSYYFLFGSLTGLLWYFYGAVRGLTLLAFLRVLLDRSVNRFKFLGIFFLGVTVVIIPGVLFLWQLQKGYHGDWHYFMVDRDNIFDDKKWALDQMSAQLKVNILLSLKRVFAFQQLMDPPMAWENTARFLNPCLVLPMLVGALKVSFARKEVKHQFFVLLFLLIFVTPVLTNLSTGTRRYICLVIPIYACIGIGFVQLINGLSVLRPFLRNTMFFALILMTSFVNYSEGCFIREHILFGNRDFGLLNLAKNIKAREIKGNIYYLESDSLYRGTRESDLMRMALFDHGHLSVNILKAALRSPLPGSAQNFYVIKGSGISGQELKQWMDARRFHYQCLSDSEGFFDLGNLNESRQLVQGNQLKNFRFVQRSNGHIYGMVNFALYSVKQ